MATFAARCAMASRLDGPPAPAATSMVAPTPSASTLASPSAAPPAAAPPCLPSGSQGRPSSATCGDRASVAALEEAITVAREVAARLQSAQSVIHGARNAGISFGTGPPGVVGFDVSRFRRPMGAPPLQPLTPEQKEMLRAQGICTRCRLPGHSIANCPRNLLDRRFPVPPTTPPPIRVAAPQPRVPMSPMSMTHTPASASCQPFVGLRRSLRIQEQQQQKGAKPLRRVLALTVPQQQQPPPADLAAATISAQKESAFSDAPPTSPPSMSGKAMSPSTLSGLTLPP